CHPLPSFPTRRSSDLTKFQAPRTKLTFARHWFLEFGSWKGRNRYAAGHGRKNYRAFDLLKHLHDGSLVRPFEISQRLAAVGHSRSEEHTSELQSPYDL